MTLSEAYTYAQERIGRPLLSDEVAALGRLVEHGAGVEHLEQAVALFDERPPDIDEDGVPVNRYEQGVDAEGQIVVRQV